MIMMMMMNWSRCVLVGYAVGHGGGLLLRGLLEQYTNCDRRCICSNSRLSDDVVSVIIFFCPLSFLRLRDDVY